MDMRSAARRRELWWHCAKLRTSRQHASLLFAPALSRKMTLCTLVSNALLCERQASFWILN